MMDLTGRVVGDFTVLRRAGKSNEGRVTWLIECNRGHQRVSDSKTIVNGAGVCLVCRRLDARMRRIGSRIGKLVIVSYDEAAKQFLAQCDCGGQHHINLPRSFGDFPSCCLACFKRESSVRIVRVVANRGSNYRWQRPRDEQGSFVSSKNVAVTTRRTSAPESSATVHENPSSERKKRVGSIDVLGVDLTVPELAAICGLSDRMIRKLRAAGKDPLERARNRLSATLANGTDGARNDGESE